MNKAHIQFLEDKYIEAVNGYVRAYVDKHEGMNPVCWAGGCVGEVLIFDGGRRIDFRDIKANIDNDVQVMECLAAQTDEVDFMGKEEICGTCNRSGITCEGDICRCSRDGKYHKYYDKACEEHAKGAI